MAIIQEIQKKQKRKKRVLESAKKWPDARNEFINLFEKGIFPYKGNVFKTKEKEESEELDQNKFSKNIENESEGVNYSLFGKHFKFSVPYVLAKTLFETKKKKKKNVLVNAIKSGLRDLKNEIEEMSEDEK